ncbi:MAG: 23S rRNA (cytidine(2498)-2'-O)-methyltransferase RlmM [Betaproteobacteria bacterium]|nr:23S rRNA (cytidine(2498)-2'-O)-methyltransferase RlmM [Betaproteobacteria bacterium]
MSGEGGLLVHCRAGFEKECAQELTAIARDAGVEGFVKARPDSAWALFQPFEVSAGRKLWSELTLDAFVFARQVVLAGEVLSDLPVGDRASPLARAARELGTRFRELFIETPDTNDGKALASLIRPLKPHLDKALAKAGVNVADAAAQERLHVFFVGGTAAHVGLSRVGASSPWPMGIARLRMPAGAPSRSTLKLAEALAHFLGDEEAARRLTPGMSAVDLGASPGGWTWQLVRRGLFVTAVDNGPMDGALLETGQVKHRRADAFGFRPPEPVDWMVCDVVESPSRVAALAAKWVVEGWCREAIFNLKLPMKKRWEETGRAREIVDEAFGGRRYRLAMKQLYHDREEITAWLAAGDDRKERGAMLHSRRSRDRRDPRT